MIFDKEQYYWSFACFLSWIGNISFNTPFMPLKLIVLMSCETSSGGTCLSELNQC